MNAVLSFYDFMRRFPSEEECFQYLVNLRWSDGFCCPKCGHDKSYFLGKYKRFECKLCHHQTTVTAGTVFHRMRQPLHKLLFAVYMVATSKKGVSAMELQRKLDIRSYQTAWHLLHKIRNAMSSSELFPLTGDVEVDETYIGGRRPGKRGRGAEGKSLVGVVVETNGKYMGRTYIEEIKSASTENIKSFLSRHLSPGVKVTTDGLHSYKFLSEKYMHVPVIGSKTTQKEELLPKAHIVIANLKTWLRGTYNCLPNKHLQQYLNEFVFRFNRRWKIENIFDKLLTRCVSRATVTYSYLTG